MLHFFRKNPAAVTVEEMHTRLIISGNYLGKSEETKLIREGLESLCQKNLVKESGGRWSLIDT